MMAIMPTGWLLLALVAMGLLHVALPLGRVLPPPWRLAGLLPLAIGIGLNLAADRDFRRAQTTVKPFAESRALLTGGIFRFSRNPMYLGFILAVAGTALLLGSASPWLAVPLLFFILREEYVRREEERLAAAFGRRWQEYRAATRRWL